MSGAESGSENPKIAVRNDEELSKLLGSVTIANRGVLPNIHQTRLPKKTKGGVRKGLKKDGPDAIVARATVAGDGVG
ncbi:hypothetical protein CDL15_Pgr006942 [Punica granatum]|uniref:Histone H2A C-terminal domain-containing protein n=1 Tax=Punica granatum TaxID=22663 RepID=A0A218X8R7_PUNGR|nr:hypothetical protein CDL15_Pgr006942 [Punica granatum]